MHITPFIFAFVIMLFLKTVHTGLYTQNTKWESCDLDNSLSCSTLEDGGKGLVYPVLYSSITGDSAWSRP